MQHLLLSRERVNASELPPQRAASRDSLRNGALIGAAVGAAVLGGLAATICHVQRERAARAVCLTRCDSRRSEARLAWARELSSTSHGAPVR